MNLPAVDWLAVSIAIALALGFIAGANRGLIPAILELLALVFALQIACRHYEYVGRLFRFALNTGAYQSRILGLVATFVAMSVVAGVATSLLAGLARGAGVSPVDRLLGGIAGLARSYILVAFCIWFVLHMPVEMLVPHISGSGVSMAIVRSVPVLFESVGVSLPTASGLGSSW